ncbi:MAG: 50S ribosomal protein L4 [Gemmatimonadota bacterium]|jgi:large subunit ribosomal protein L4|nr:50S ribosomal protein L4 [Gemmatimonadota bacterium]MDP6803418.1 50S ribosomal protein L4 [Gemmatimonadota bacterium]MDP7032373.1 50S ribosomal protein L4 [Gemmatimonadota bacterium]
MMATATAYGASGEKSGTVDLPEQLFGIEPNAHVVWEAVVNFEANQRKGTAKVKSRGEVNLSNAKPWRQKGTGRARAGSARSPVWVGGGTVHGPKPRDYRYRLPKKTRRLALKSALSDRAASERILVVDDFGFEDARTQSLATFLDKLGLGGEKVLLLTGGFDEKVNRSAQNLSRVLCLPARETYTYAVVASNWVVMTRDALKKLEEVFV